MAATSSHLSLSLYLSLYLSLFLYLSLGSANGGMAEGAIGCGCHLLSFVGEKPPEINLAPSNDSFFHPATPAMFIAIAATIMIMVALMVATQYGN